MFQNERNTSADITISSTHPSPFSLFSIAWEGDYTTDIIVVSNYIHRLTTEAALYVAAHLRPDDYREVTEGMALLYPSSVATFDADDIYFTVPNGETAGMAGIERWQDLHAMYSAIEKYPITFAREAKKYIDSRPEPMLWNIIDKRNTVHLKLLKWLGFEFLEEFGTDQTI